MMLPRDGDHEPRPCRHIDLAHVHREARGGAEFFGIIRERGLRLGYADGKLAVAQPRERAQAARGGRLEAHPVRAVDALGDGLDFLLERHIEGIKRRVGRIARLRKAECRLCEFESPLASFAVKLMRAAGALPPRCKVP